MREARALVRDRVLGDLHHDELPVLEHALDLGLAAAFDVGLVEGDVTAVEHAVLRRADVDERGLHAREHVLHPAEVDVAVDRVGAFGRGQRVLDETATLEHRDVRVATLERVDAHQVATRGTSLAGAAPAALHRFVVELERGLVAQPEVGAHDVVGARPWSGGGPGRRIAALAVGVAPSGPTAGAATTATTAPAAAALRGAASPSSCSRRSAAAEPGGPGDCHRSWVGRARQAVQAEAPGGNRRRARLRAGRRQPGFLARDLGDVVVGQAAIGAGVEVALGLRGGPVPRNRLASSSSSSRSASRRAVPAGAGGARRPLAVSPAARSAPPATWRRAVRAWALAVRVLWGGGLSRARGLWLPRRAPGWRLLSPEWCRRT